MATLRSIFLSGASMLWDWKNFFADVSGTNLRCPPVRYDLYQVLFSLAHGKVEHGTFTANDELIEGACYMRQAVWVHGQA